MPNITEILGSENVGDSLPTINQNFSNLALNANTTVNLDSSMTAAGIQALIDAQPKNLNGMD